jgi:hypothetical protein
VYDDMAKHTIVGTNYFMHELHRRDNDRLAKRMERLTWIATGSAAASVEAVFGGSAACRSARMLGSVGDLASRGAPRLIRPATRPPARCAGAPYLTLGSRLLT